MTDEHTSAGLADAIYRPPVVFLGLTANDVVSIGCAAAGVGIVLGLVAGIAAGHVVVAVMGFIVGCVLAWLGLAQRVRFYTANRPIHYLKERLHRWRATHGLGGSPLIHRSGRWSRGRSIGFPHGPA